MTEQAEIWMRGYIDCEDEEADLYHAGYLASEIGIKLDFDSESEKLADDAPWDLRQWFDGYQAADAKGQPENQTSH